MRKENERRQIKKGFKKLEKLKNWKNLNLEKLTHTKTHTNPKKPGLGLAGNRKPTT